MKRKSVLYIGNKLAAKGSTVTSIETLGNFLKDEGHTVYMASSVKNKILRLLDMLFSVVKYRNKVSIVLIDTYSTQNFYFAVAVANLCRLLKLPYVPILRGGNLPERLQKSKANAYKLFTGAKTNVAPSQYLMDAFVAEGYTNLTYIPNTIEISKYPFLLRKEIQPKLLWVRSFAQLYNPILAIELVASLKELLPEISLCMVGPDKDGSLDICKAYVEKHELPVTFTGKLSKEAWRDLAKDHDIFINTTNYDNTPVSVIEAMALGLPVISTNVGGLPFLIEDGKDGILVPPAELKGFEDSILSLCSDEHLALAISQAAREKVEGFDWQKLKHQWAELL